MEQTEHMKTAQNLFKINDIFQFIKQGNIKKIKETINGFKDVLDEENIAKIISMNINPPDSTFLIEACEKGDPGIVELFLSYNGINVNVENSLGHTPLIKAILNKNEEIVYILCNDPRVDVNYGSVAKPMNIAVDNRHHIIVEILLSRQDINLQDTDSLLLAVKNRDLTSISLMVERGFNINKIERNMTPLIFAIQNGYKDIVEYLLNKGSDINLANNDGVTPLFIAIIKSDYDIISFLLDKGANINAVDNSGNNISYYSSGVSASIKKLLEDKLSEEKKEEIIQEETQENYFENRLKQYYVIEDLLQSFKDKDKDSDGKDFCNLDFKLKLMDGVS